MAEIKRPVVPIEVNYLCDSCGHGMMKNTGPADADGMVPHECVICGFKQAFKYQVYPRIDYIGEDDPRPQ